MYLVLESIVAGNYDIMAAVMIGGMVPPCAIALATLLFKNKFTKEERKSGPVNFIMGLAFITEGAIPYAAADPIRVLPSCVVGSAVAGALSMAFGCTLMAPHGGIFVCTGYGQCRYVSGGTCSRNRYFRRFTRSLEEKSK